MVGIRKWQKVIPWATVLTLIFATLTSPLVMSVSYASGSLDSTSPSSVTIPAGDDSASIDFAIPSSVSLGSGDTVNWAVTNIQTQDVLGNPAIQFPGALKVLSSHIGIPTDGFQYSLQAIGRRATLTAKSYFAGTYIVTISGTAQGELFTKTMNLIFAPNSIRVPMAYTNGTPPTVAIDSPDVGKDLQTTIRFKVSWSEATNSANPGTAGPQWVSMETVDPTGNLIRQPWDPRIFWDDPMLNQTLSTGTDWISLPVSYQDWIKWGGVHILIWWTLESGVTGQYLSFAKTFDIPVNFPVPKPYLTSRCQDVRVESPTYCTISLSYKDAMGNTANSVPQNISWTLTDGKGASKTGLVNQVTSGATVNVPVSKGTGTFTLVANIAGTTATTTAVAKPHNYQADTAKSLKITKSCPSSFKGNTFKCTVGISGTALNSPTFKVLAQERVDNKSWVTKKTLTMKLGQSVSVTLPNVINKSLDMRAITTFLGKTYSSSIQSWITDTPATLPTASHPVSLTFLNSLSLGKWRAGVNIQTPGVAAIYLSDWPCLLYVTDSVQSANSVYENGAIYNAYIGFWLNIPTKNWVVNDVSSSGNCYNYFSSHYGGYGVHN